MTWDVKNGVNGIVDNAKNAGKLSMDTVYEAQKGATVISACKMAIKSTPGIPEAVKNIVNTEGYGDVIVGLVAQTLVDSFSDNPMARELAKNANVYGSTIASSKVSFIQDLIGNTIMGIASKTEKIVNTVQNKETVQR